LTAKRKLFLKAQYLRSLVVVVCVCGGGLLVVVVVLGGGGLRVEPVGGGFEEVVVEDVVVEEVVVEELGVGDGVVELDEGGVSETVLEVVADEDGGSVVLLKVEEVESEVG
jgi:hypothetical protein